MSACTQKPIAVNTEPHIDLMDFGSSPTGEPISSLLAGVSSLSLARRQCRQLQHRRLLPSLTAGLSPRTLAQPGVHRQPEQGSSATRVQPHAVPLYDAPAQRAEKRCHSAHGSVCSTCRGTVPPGGHALPPAHPKAPRTQRTQAMTREDTSEVFMGGSTHLYGCHG